MQQEKLVSAKEFYDSAVQQLERELTLINNRISWMLTFQGFLFTTMALVANKNTERAIAIVFRNVIPTIGIVVAFFAFIGVHAAHLSIKNIKTRWKKNLGYLEYSPAFGTSTSSILGKVPSYGIPVSMMIAWLLFLIGLINAG